MESENNQVTKFDCPKVKTDRQLPFWWPSWLSLIRLKAYSNLGGMWINKSNAYMKLEEIG